MPSRGSTLKIVLLAFSHIEYVIELAEALSDDNEVILMIPQKDSERFKGAVKSEVKVMPFRKPRMRNPANCLAMYELIRNVCDLRAEVIHIQHLPGEHPWFDLFLPMIGRKFPLVSTVHDVILHSGDRASFRLNMLYKWNNSYIDQIIVHGEALKHEMISEYAISPAHVNVVPRGINSIYKRYINKNHGEEKNTILFFGRIWPYKGLRYLIEAEPLISDKVHGLKIIIAGRGEEFYRYRDIMVNKDKYVVYNEHISNDFVAELFQKASLVVLPYTDASQSGVIPLAYSFSKPVVVTNVGCLPDVVDDGITGLIVPPKNAARLAEAIVELLVNDEIRERMGDNALRKAQNELSWGNIALKTIDIYNKALTSRNRHV